MNTVITTKSIGPGIVKVEEDFILCEEPMSRLVFQAQIHEKGIRGKIIRQRRESPNDKWIPDQAIDIRTLGKKESINFDINTGSVKNLYLAFNKLTGILKQRGIEYGENKYAVVNPETVVVTDENKITYIRKLVEAGYDEEVWTSLAESNPDLVTKLSYARLQTKKQEVVEELNSRLATNEYPETSGRNSWQSWIYEHNWLFGVNYKKPIEKTRINLTGIMPDYLFPTLDGFVDILEIKLPNDEVIVPDRNHTGSWKWTQETNAALGQVINYLGEIDRLRLEIERNVLSTYGHELCIIKPRAHILIGNSVDWENTKKEALRKMNHSLHGIEIVTYKDLIDRGNQSIQTLPEDI